MKKIIFALILITLILPNFSSVLAQTAPRPLEVQYPKIPGTTTPTVIEFSFPEYAKYIFYFFIAVSGIAGLLVIVIGGVQYVISAGNIEKTKDAKDQITAAVFGLLILLCSYLVIYTINPQIAVFHLSAPPVPPDIKSGVLLCRERVDVIGFWGLKLSFFSLAPQQQETAVAQMKDILKKIDKECRYQATPGLLLDAPEFEDKIKWVYLIPERQKLQYGTILYEERKYKGRAVVIYGDGSGGVHALENPTEWSLPADLKVSSVMPFLINYRPAPSWYISLYESVSYNQYNTTAKSVTHSTAGISGAEVFSVIPGTKEIGSLKIEGNLIVIFFKNGGGWTLETEIDVFTQSDNNLNGNIMGRWDPSCVVKGSIPLFDRYYPCADHIVVVPYGNSDNY
jgi:hypothetical protein